MCDGVSNVSLFSFLILSFLIMFFINKCRGLVTNRNLIFNLYVCSSIIIKLLLKGMFHFRSFLMSSFQVNKILALMLGLWFLYYAVLWDKGWLWWHPGAINRKRWSSCSRRGLLQLKMGHNFFLVMLVSLLIRD